MNKTKKALASLAIAGMVLSMAPVSVFAAETETRLAGADRYLTSIKIAEKAYASADTAVVAAGNPNNLVDALAAAPLAAQEDAPIYLTDKADMNDDVVKSMKALGVDKVIVVGAAASKAVVDELKAAGFSVEEVKGAGRVETAEAINKKLTAPAGTFVVGYDGVADAMSVASYAAANNYAIVVANQNGTPNGTVDADYIVGGTTRVKDIAGAVRLAGADRYDTNKQVIAELDFDFGTVYVGNGLTLADALVGSVLAAQTDSPIALTDGKTVKADIASNLDADSVVVALGGTTAVSNAVIDAVKNPPSTGEFKVDSVAAAAANAFKVKFGAAAADTEKVTFEVKNAGTAMTTTVNWNEAKTEASLVYSANFPQGDYTVAVKEGTKELGSFEVKIEQQKVAKIDVTSDVLSVDIETGVGYAVYKVYDQYGMDITSLPLAKNIKWTAGIGVLDETKTKDGLIVVKPDENSKIPLLSYSSCVVSGYDQNNYVNVNVSLSVSQATGTISKLNLKELYSLNDDEFNTGNRETGKWYIEYEALDASGNPTTNYDLINAGVLNVNGGGYVEAEVVKDPKDNKKAAIEVVQTEQTQYLNMDVPVTITVILKNGQNATFTTTLSLGARPDSITLYSPAETVASGERFIIPFVVYDQNGKEIKSFSKIRDNVDITVSNADGNESEWLKNADGSASLAVTAPALTGTEKSRTIFVMASIKNTAKNSRINVTVQEAVKADSLSINTAKLTQAMQKGASQSASLGTALVVKDQYGREFDMVAQSDYKVKIEAGTTVSVNNAQLAGSTKKATFTAGNNVGTQVVTFSLVDKDGEEIDSRNFSFTVVDDKNIVDYTLGELDTIYTVADNETKVVAEGRDQEYIAELKVFGALSNGSKVILAPTFNGKNTVQNVSVSGSDFTVAPKDAGGWTADTVTTVSAVKFAANSSKTSASAQISVVVNGTDGRIYPLSANVTSSKDAPVVESIGYEIDNANQVKAKNDRITMKEENIGNGLLSEFSVDGLTSSTCGFYFFGEDQYGTEGGKIDVYLADQTGDLNATITNNVLSIASGETGSITITAVAGSVSRTVTIDIVE